jgi:hypothetical protein
MKSLEVGVVEGQRSTLVLRSSALLSCCSGNGAIISSLNSLHNFSTIYRVNPHGINAGFFVHCSNFAIILVQFGHYVDFEHICTV